MSRFEFARLEGPFMPGKPLAPWGEKGWELVAVVTHGNKEIAWLKRQLGPGEKAGENPGR